MEFVKDTYLGGAVSFHLGSVVEYLDTDGMKYYGHVDGFAVNSVKEILVVVKFPMDSDGNYPLKKIHPSKLTRFATA